VSTLPYEAKALLEIFCKIAPLGFLDVFYIGESGLNRTDDFQKFCGSGLDSDRKISQLISGAEYHK